MATGGAHVSDSNMSNSENEADEMFECSVCFESMMEKQPRFLHCGHTFCTPCLEQTKKQDISCPKCRTTTKITKGIKGLLEKQRSL